MIVFLCVKIVPTLISDVPILSSLVLWLFQGAVSTTKLCRAK